MILKDYIFKTMGLIKMEKKRNWYYCGCRVFLTLCKIISKELNLNIDEHLSLILSRPKYNKYLLNKILSN